MRERIHTSVLGLVLLAVLVMAVPFALADDATITLGVDPTPPNCAPQGTDEEIFWSILHSTTPDFVYYALYDPHMVLIEDEVYDGSTGHEITRFWTVPIGAEAGAYWTHVEYWSVEVGLEARADVMFLVCAPEAPCCIDEQCQILTEAECLAAGGTWHPELPDCGPPDPCAPRHVCCVCELCYVVTQQECTDMAGTWYPDLDSCEPNPCTPSPADDSTWGEIKSLYR